MKQIGLYVHVPFCVRKCGYCDFYSIKWDQVREKNYVDALLREARSYREEGAALNVDTIFIGGGTPSVLTLDSTESVLKGIYDIYHVDDHAEVTIELNPNSITQERLQKYLQWGINRLSIGIQSMDDGILKKIGRLHSAREACEAVEMARRTGFDNINSDIMFNIPGQTAENILSTIDRTIDTGVKHISFYSLKLEEGTPMYNQERDRLISMPDEDEERRMYYAGREAMEQHGFRQYEISNFALPGYECRHNLKYWRQQEYIGLGPAAHSFTGNERYGNAPDLELYCQGGAASRQVYEIMDKKEMMFEYVMLNLRLTTGIRKENFLRKFGVSFDTVYGSKTAELEGKGLVNTGENSVSLTHLGMDLSNYVFEQFM